MEGRYDIAWDVKASKALHTKQSSARIRREFEN